MNLGLVQCAEHGETTACFVCRHLSASLFGGLAGLGFVVPEVLEPGEPPQAWCFECDGVLQSRGGEWDTIGEAFAGITLACSGCFDRMKALNSRPWPTSADE
jgi:hypothetical protein